jgi:hypothetical protein
VDPGHADAVACGKAANVRAGLDHAPDHLVTENERELDDPPKLGPVAAGEM